jgi:hypothetical protein
MDHSDWIDELSKGGVGPASSLAAKNHSSWEQDAVTLKLGPKYAAYLVQGALEAILAWKRHAAAIISPAGSVPKKGPDLFRAIADARIANLGVGGLGCEAIHCAGDHRLAGLVLHNVRIWGMAITHRCLADAPESSYGGEASPAWKTTRTMTGSCASDSSGDIGYTSGAARRQRGQIRVGRLNQIQSRSESARSIRVSQHDPSRPSQPVRPEPVAIRVGRVNPSQPA